MGAGNKQAVQVVVLILLLAVLVFGGWRMYKTLAPHAPPTPAGKPAGAGAPVGAGVARPGGGAPGAPSGPPGQPAQPGQAQADASTAPPAPSTFPVLPGGEVNPDLFRVYALQPPKNPFLMQEAWFKDALEQVPGYPELRDSQYFEHMDPAFPDVATLFGPDKDWTSVTLHRQDQGQYSLIGSSKDGRIQTKVEAQEAVPGNVELTWTEESGLPLSALRNPEYVRQHSDQLIAAPGAQAAAGEAAGAGGLAVPGGAMGEAPGSAIAPGGKGDVLVCAGVNLKNGRSSALMYFNGAPYLVTLGSVIPTHYQVLEIKDDGVVMLELRDGSSTWVPLTGTPPPEQKK
jgi:hypothetical protein